MGYYNEKSDVGAFYIITLSVKTLEKFHNRALITKMHQSRSFDWQIEEVKGDVKTNNMLES